MDNRITFSCILCNKIGVNFQCERCNETYCSSDCQAAHWPIHRRMCFPMPNLIPLEDLKISSNPSLPSDLATARQCSKFNWNSDNKSDVVSNTSRYLEHQLPEDSVFESSAWDEPVIDTLQSKKWFEEFFFGQITNVIVQYFEETPSTTCWVIQQTDVDRRDAILKSLNLYRSFDTIDPDDIKLDKLYNVQFEGVCHRGLILHRINSSQVWVRLIDNGRSFRARVSAIRKLHRTVEGDLKGLAFEIQFEKLRRVRVDEVLRVENISHNSDGTIDVRFVKAEKIFTVGDIETIPLPLNVPMELYCLDYSNIHEGYISACKNDRQKIESLVAISDKISDHCKKTNSGKGYCPKSNELCLAYDTFAAQWYRSKCVETLMPNVFKLEMIDYGVMEDVNSKNIRKMVKTFLEPSIMHRCTIFGVHPKPDLRTTTKIIAYFSGDPIFCAKRARLSAGQYMLYLPDLLKLLNE